MNFTFIIGNLTKDPERTETSSGVAVCRFSVAVKRDYKGVDGNYAVDYYNCVAWRNLADTVSRYAHKGNKVAVTGRMESETFEKDGKKQISWKLNCEKVEFLTPKGDQKEIPSKAKPTLSPVDDDIDIPF